MRTGLALCVFLLAIGAGVAHADTVTTFSLSGTTDNFGPFTGTITIDTTTGVITGVNAVFPFSLDPSGQPNSLTVVVPGTEASYSIYGLSFESVFLENASDEFNGDNAFYMPANFLFSDYYGDFPENYPFLVGFTGGLPFCSIGDEAACTIPSEFTMIFQQGETSDDSGYVTDGGIGGPVTSVTTTPEPSSFALLGTGLLGAAGVMRRRLRC